MSAPIPPRYERTVAELFDAALGGLLRPGLDVLDVGSGRRPTLEPGRRPPDCRYVGLDASGGELAAAPAGSYAEVVVADVLEPVERLGARFDLILSAQMLEHVESLAGAVENLHGYLRPGGHLVALLSGRYAPNAILNRLIPPRLATPMMHALLDRDPETVFPAHYDRCTQRALAGLLATWSAAEITPLYQGGSYFNFWLPLRSLYFVYESWAAGHPDLATHYLVLARR